MEIEKIKRRLKRLEHQRDVLEANHKGREVTHFSYWGGFELGYLKGKITVLEDILEEMIEESN